MKVIFDLVVEEVKVDKIIVGSCRKRNESKGSSHLALIYRLYLKNISDSND